MPRILIVEDERIQRKHMREFLAERKHKTDEAESVEDALKLIESNYYDIILSDMKLNKSTGDKILEYLTKNSIDIPLIFITAFGTIDESVKMIRQGASDYVTKPVNLEELEARIEKAVLMRDVKNEIALLKGQSGENGGIVYKSQIMEDIIGNSIKYAASTAPVLICGESGTGKELIARLIHRHSERAERTFVPVNSGALNENLLESELFGHEKGAFTGAEKKRAGRFEMADGGTIFLDEIGDISLSMQVKLLRVIQEGEFERVGGNRTIKTDVRIIAATNRDLKKMINEGTFREDLFFRLNVLNVHIPPLRDRQDDIPLIARHYINNYAKINGKRIRGITDKAIEKLKNYRFPGNIRELQNIIQRAVILTERDKLTERDIIIGSDSNSVSEKTGKGLEYAVHALEKEMIINALRNNRYSVKEAANDLEITERQIRYKMKKYSITEEK